MLAVSIIFSFLTQIHLESIFDIIDGTIKLTNKTKRAIFNKALLLKTKILL